MQALFTLPAIHDDVARRMQDSATIIEQSPSKRLGHGPKRDGIDEFSVARLESRPHMAFGDEVRINECVGRKRQKRFWISGSVGACPLQHVGECEIEAPGRYRAVD